MAGKLMMTKTTKFKKGAKMAPRAQKGGTLGGDAEKEFDKKVKAAKKGKK